MALFEGFVPVSMPVDHFMFRAGKSAPEAKEAMAALETNMKDIGLDRKFISMGGKSVPAPVMTRRTLGLSVSNEVLEKFGFSPLLDSSAAHADTIRPNQVKALQQMLQHEGIKIKDSNMITNLLVFKGSQASSASQTGNLKFALHEIGHGVSTVTDAAAKSNASRDFLYLNQSLREFADEVRGAETPFSVTQDIADEFKSTYLRAMGEHGIEEARAESFSGLISKTKLGQEGITKILNGRVSEEDIGRTFLTGYHKMSEDRLPFGSYSKYYLDKARNSSAYNAIAAHIDFDELEKLGAIEAHGRFMGSIDYR
jgi:hypothetical protein